MKTPEIMATIGPTLEKPKDLRRAVEAGARWFRLPCGYRQRPHLLNAQAVRQAAADCGTPVQLLMDLPSSRPRTAKMEDLRLEVGGQARFFDPQTSPPPADEPDATAVPLPGLRALVEKMAVGHRMWFCDGRLEFTIDEMAADSVAAHLTRGSGLLKSSNSIYLPDSPSPFQMITAEDSQLLQGFVDAGVAPDWIAFSLVSSAQDVEIGRETLRPYFGDAVRVMAKIETAAAVQRVDAILEAADGIMVARGDLGPAVDFIGLPEAQEELVAAAQRAGKTVVVATQILECFAESGAPQRSELSGLAVLAQQAPDAIMLGKETVYSPRPIETIQLAVDALAYETRRLEARRNRLPRQLRASAVGPYLVAIEGPNGAGKTRLCELLGERLEATMLRGVPQGWEDSSLKLRMIRDADWMAAAMFFLSGVIESSREAKRSERELVVMDRSLWSTLAVHYAHDPCRLTQLMPLLECAADRLMTPNLTIVLEVSPETCRKRIAMKPARQRRFDAASPDMDAFHQRERQFYHWLVEQGQQVIFVDAETCDPETLCARTADLIRESVPCFALVTGNPRKYAPLGGLCESLGIELRKRDFELPELQDVDFVKVVAHKARHAAEALGAPCLVDDAGLLLDAYPGFPGTMTGAVCRLLGAQGFQRLLAGTSARGRMVCHLGCWAGGRLWHWQGEVAGRLDPLRAVGDGPGPLTQWFVPDAEGPEAVFLHRRRALEALGRDLGLLREAIGTAPGPRPAEPPDCGDPSCVFCQEFAGEETSIYHKMLGRELPSRVLHQTEHFVVFPPLGQFIEGGLLLATRQHLLSMAVLPKHYYPELELLMRQTGELLQERYGCRPLFFEHAPIGPGVKGTCCVDHAHLNVFPAQVDVHRRLAEFPHRRIERMDELASVESAYLFLQGNSGERFVYEAGVVPSQYVRKIVTAELGMPQRGHWRDYLGLDELKRTYAALAGWRVAR